MKKKILITGSSGFIGLNVVKSLSKQYDLICPSRDQIMNFKIPLSEFEGILHLAGKAHDLKKTSNENEYYDINTDLTIKIFNAFLKSKSKFFIFFSSIKAVADKIDGVLYESQKPNPITHYGKSKLLAENYILSKTNKNKRIYILRLSMVYGPKNKGNLNLLYKTIKKRIPWPLGAYSNQISICSVDNLIFIVNKIIKSKILSSGVYNISNDESISTNRIIEIINESLNNKNIILKIPKFFIKTIALFGDYFYLPLNSERLVKLTESYIVNNSKIKKGLEINLLPYNSEDTLRKTFSTFKV